MPLTDTTNENNTAAAAAAADSTESAKADTKARAPRPPKQRGPPEDGIASTTKVMVANLPYDLREEKVGFDLFLFKYNVTNNE